MSSNTPAIRPHVEIVNGQLVTNSFKIAEHFGKNHKDVLRAIDGIECSSDFRQRNFAPTSAPVPMPRGGHRHIKAYSITRDGFTFLAMGFTGAKAAQWKEAYINAFNRMEAALREPVHQPAPVPALPARRIRSRDDLSFTARDANGCLLNWRAKARAGSWHEHVSLGHAWFQEIIQLAQHSPEEAYQALLYAGCSEVLLKHWDHGHEHGFMDVFARFAVAAMIASDGTLPDLPFTVREMGVRALGQGTSRS